MSGRDDRIYDDNIKLGTQGKPAKGGTFLGGPYNEQEKEIAEDANRRGREIRIQEQVRKEENP